MLDICKACGEWLVGEWTRAHHRCQPRWRVWCPDRGETHQDGEVIRAVDSEDAAVKWAEDRSENYELIDNPETVRVVSEADYPRDDGEGFDEFQVMGEATINFYAHKTDREGGE